MRKVQKLHDVVSNLDARLIGFAHDESSDLQPRGIGSASDQGQHRVESAQRNACPIDAHPIG